MCLHCNGITNVVNIVDNLSEVLLNNCHMQKFYISDNRLQTGGIMKILGVLTHFDNLTDLSIGSNNISDKFSDYTVQRRF